MESFFNLANGYLKTNRMDQALHYFTELHKLNVQHAPLIWWRVFSVHGSALIASGGRNIEYGAKL